MNEKVVGLIRTGGVILLFLIGIILILKAMGTTATIDQDTQEIVEEVDQVTSSVSYALYLVYACLGAILVFTVWAVIQNPKRFIPTLIGLGVFVVIAFIGYSVASSEIIPDLLEHDNATKSAHKMGGAGIKTTYILVVIAILLIIVGSVMSSMRYFAKSK
jgi:hypothetical protein